MTAEGEDADIVRQVFAAREVASLAEAGKAEPEDVTETLEGLRDI